LEILQWIIKNYFKKNLNLEFEVFGSNLRKYKNCVSLWDEIFFFFFLLLNTQKSPANQPHSSQIIVISTFDFLHAHILKLLHIYTSDKAIFINPNSAQLKWNGTQKCASPSFRPPFSSFPPA
jgi:hypothetical protein